MTERDDTARLTIGMTQLLKRYMSDRHDEFYPS